MSVHKRLTSDEDELYRHNKTGDEYEGEHYDKINDGDAAGKSEQLPKIKGGK